MMMKGHVPWNKGLNKSTDNRLGHSPETRRLIGKARLGKKRSPETIEKIRQGNIGQKRSAEQIERMKQGHPSKYEGKTALDRHLINKFGITEEEYNSMLKAQNGVCKICGRPETARTKKRLSVDHDHKTGKVRGLLCFWCNWTLGAYERNREKIDTYLAGSSDL